MSSPALPVAVTSASAVAAGGNHVLAVVPPDKVVAWGDNSWGQTNVPAGASGIAAVAAGEDTSLAITSAGSVLAWGDNRYRQAEVPALPLPAVQVAAGESHAMALLDAGPDYPSGPAVGMTNQLGGANAFFTLGKRGWGTSYQWQLNGVPLPGYTGPSLSLAGLHWTNSGTYRLVVSNVNGGTTTSEMVVTVERQPLRFTTPALRQAAGVPEFQAALEGAAGIGPLVVLASTNLATWHPVLTNPPAIGRVLLDSIPVNHAASVFRAVEMPSPGPIRIASGEGSTPPWRLEVTGVSATAPVVIQVSGDLAAWQAIFTNPPTTGPIVFWDWKPDPSQSRFYRALELR